MNTYKLWVDQHPKDFEDRQSLFVKQFYTFVSNHLIPEFNQHCEAILEILDGKRNRPTLIYTSKEKKLKSRK